MQALQQDKARSSASAEAAITTESIGETELSEDDAVSLGGSPRVSLNFDGSLEACATVEVDTPVATSAVCTALPAWPCLSALGLHISQRLPWPCLHGWLLCRQAGASCLG